MLHQNSGAPIRLQYLQLMHSFGVATSARVHNSSQSSKTQQRQTKKQSLIGDGKGNCDNAQLGFSGDGYMGWSSVKPEQKEVVEAILKTDVFVILPSGFGNSACYQCLPLLHKKLYPDSD